MHDETRPVSDEKYKGMKTIYTICKRQDDPEKSYWVRIGTAFTNRDGSLNCKLDATPTNATLHIRDYEPRDRDRAPFRGDGGGAARNELRFNPSEIGGGRPSALPLDGGLR